MTRFVSHLHFDIKFLFVYDPSSSRPISVEHFEIMSDSKKKGGKNRRQNPHPPTSTQMHGIEGFLKPPVQVKLTRPSWA